MNQFKRFWHTRPKKLAITIAIASSFLLVLPSCIPILRKPALAPPVPEDFYGQTSPDSSAQVSIEEFFDDPLLIGLIRWGLAGNQELRILNETIQIASNEVLSRRGTYLPFLTAGGGASLNKISSYTPEGAGIRDDPFRPGQFIPNPFGNFIFGANLTWQIDVWRQLRNARDAAAQRFLAAAQERNYFVTRLVAEVADNYYQLMALDARLENLNRIIDLQERSLEIAKARKAAARGTDLPVQRFQAEVRKNQAEKLIVNQDIIQTENRINFALGRFPQRIERRHVNFIELQMHALSLGIPPQLIQNRRDIIQAEHNMAAAGLDIKVARARFFPVVMLNGGVGYQAFNANYLLLTPGALIGNIAGGLIGPMINFKAIKADFLTANAAQLQTIYNYQRVIINAVTEVITRVAKVENYGTSVGIKKLQVQALEKAVIAATSLYQLPRGDIPIDYLDVLTAQNELFQAIRDLIDTKGGQLTAVVDTYQALGGGSYLVPIPNLAALQSLGYKHSRFSREVEAAQSGPIPPFPPPVGIGPGGPTPIPTPVLETGPGSAPMQPAETNLEPLPAPATERGPMPPPPPAPASGPKPLSIPMGGGTGPGR